MYRGVEAYLSCPLISIELETVRSNWFQGADPENVRKNGLTYQEAAHMTPLRAHSRCCEARIDHGRGQVCDGECGELCRVDERLCSRIMVLALTLMVQTNCLFSSATTTDSGFRSRLWRS